MILFAGCNINKFIRLLFPNKYKYKKKKGTMEYSYIKIFDLSLFFFLKLKKKNMYIYIFIWKKNMKKITFYNGIYIHFYDFSFSINL